MNRKLVVTFLAVSLALPAFADDMSSSSTVPIKIPAATIAGKDLGSFAPWPDSMIESGGGQHTLSTVFDGELVIGVYQSVPTRLAIDSPYPFDELVLVLSGELHLVHADADDTHVYKTGEYAIVPRGFTGTWEMKGDYRELFVIEKNAYEASQEPGGLLGE